MIRIIALPCMAAFLLLQLASGTRAEEQTPAATTTASRSDTQFLNLQDVATGSVHWTDGFWADRFTLCSTTVLAKMKEALEDPNNAACLSNFRVAAGLEEGTHRGTNWGDGDCYKWLEAMAHVYGVTRNEQLLTEMDDWIELIAKTQADDGYIGTQTQLDQNKERWGMRHYHELYSMGHLMTAASVHHQVTGKDNFLKVAVKLADYLDQVFSPRPKELAHFGWNPSNIMGLVDLYRETGDRKYLQLAGTFIDMRGSVPWPNLEWGVQKLDDPHPGDQTQDRIPLRKETRAEGHAVTAAYLYCGAADYVAETHDRVLFAALDRIWHNVVLQKMYVTGAIGAHRHGVSARYDKVHEAFGADYDLPNYTAYAETCANIANAMWNRRMLRLTGDARFADVMERVLYNSGISSMSLDGTLFRYTNPLARDQHVPLKGNDTAQRWFTSSCYCCPPSVARTLAQLHSWAYNLSDKCLWVQLYGSNQLDTRVPGAGPVQLTQRTDYPWNGKIAIRFDQVPETPFTLKLRIPAWAAGATVTVNGQDAAPRLAPSTYCELTRSWSAGDQVELDLPLDVTLVQANPLVEQARNRVAVMRGPLVYCMESVDLPPNQSFQDIAISANAQAKWSVEPGQGVLQGLRVLTTQAAVRDSGDTSDWLYRKLPATAVSTIPLTLVPYFAWNNRGVGDMSVWLPLER